VVSNALESAAFLEFIISTLISTHNGNCGELGFVDTQNTLLYDVKLYMYYYGHNYSCLFLIGLLKDYLILLGR